MKKGRLSAYYSSVKNPIIRQKDYTAFEPEHQLKLPMETEILIPKDSPVRLLNAVVERMDISNIERSCSRMGRNEYPPRILLKLLLYGYLRRIYSSRELERTCQENLRRENMDYDKATDSYTCAAGKRLTFEYDRHLKSKSGFVSTTSVYRCKDCAAP